MRKIVYNLIALLDFNNIEPQDIVKYIEPYDIFDEEEYYNLIKQKEQGQTIQELASNKANQIFTFGHCNYPNEMFVEGFKNLQKTGSRQGVLMISENSIKESCVCKFKVLQEGKPGIGAIGFGICDVSGLNICPFIVTRQSGAFIMYYTYRKMGCLNMGDVGDNVRIRDYEKGFGKGDCINMVLDMDVGKISFGVNDIMFPDKSFNKNKFMKPHLAVWMNDTGEEVQLIYEF